jgi:hypothetical protein
LLLIAAFAIYVIVTKRLRITRSVTVTGERARNFGIALLVLVIPLSLLIRIVLSAILPVLPTQLRAWPWPSLVGVVLFAAPILAMAYSFRDQPEERESLASRSQAPPAK